MHGEFEKPAYQLLNGYGCNVCNAKNNNRSELENKIYDFIRCELPHLQNIVKNTKSVLYNNGKNSLLELDLYFPSLNKAIEINGEYWHRKKECENPGCHKLKHKLCLQNNIKLLNVGYNTWFKHTEISKKRIIDFLTS